MTDSRERWQRIQPLLEQALDLPEKELAAFLDRVCGADAALRTELDALIAADRDAPPFLDRRAIDLTVPPAPPSATLEGTTLGAFTAGREIGRGGMSIVYSGERADGQFEQRVAIKVLHRDASSAGLAERFERERRILASLDHRGIVDIIDGGVTPDGRPYLVMPYIEGERIDRWCDAHRLTIRERLKLFQEVLDAIAYAHRNLVVHRDLKPDNILVTEMGEVRLLDFGIAKLIEVDAPEGSPTRTGLRPMTPEYAAPEQIRGERISTACDVYALGVLLFELLTGHRPFAAAASTPWEMEQLVLQSDPERPSEAIQRTHRATPDSDGPRTAQKIAEARGTEPLHLRTQLGGDLDAIVLMALRKEPDARYASADAFHADIERYLQSLPVLARRGSRGYRARKFVQRHRASVAAAAAAVLLILASTAAIAASSVAADRARDRAEREARTAREVTDFLVGVFAGSDPLETGGDTLSAHTLLERGRERIERELLDEPAVRASMLEAIGQVYTGLGRFPTADTLLTHALELRQRQQPPDLLQIARTHELLGHGRRSAQDHDGALEQLEQALSIRENQPASSPAEMAALLGGMTQSLAALGQADSARRVVQRALDLHRPTDDTTSVLHLQLHQYLAISLRALERFDSAAAVYEYLLPRMARHYGADHPTYGLAINNAAYLLTRQARWAEAVPLYRHALSLRLAAYEPDHPSVLTAKQNLASALYYSGETEESLGILNDRLEAIRRRWSDDHWRVGSALQGIGRFMLQEGRVHEADSVFRLAATNFRNTLGAEHEWTLVAETWVVLAMAMQRDERGMQLLDRAVERLATASLDPDTRDDIRRIADYLHEIGLPQHAVRFRALLPASGG